MDGQLLPGRWAEDHGSVALPGGSSGDSCSCCLHGAPAQLGGSVTASSAQGLTDMGPPCPKTTLVGDSSIPGCE